MIKKDAREFLPVDFSENTIWIPSDNLDNEDEVISCEKCASIDPAGVYYVATRFTLADDTRFTGFIRIAEGKITLIGLAISDSEFAFLLLVDVLRVLLGETYESFAKRLGKKSEDIFPMQYETQFSFTNGYVVQGDLHYK